VQPKSPYRPGPFSLPAWRLRGLSFTRGSKGPIAVALKVCAGTGLQIVSLYLDAIEAALEAIDRALDRIELLLGWPTTCCLSLDGQ
jgi:hypothetical protein